VLRLVLQVFRRNKNTAHPHCQAHGLHQTYQIISLVVDNGTGETLISGDFRGERIMVSPTNPSIR
jgi:hypothetical protein